MKDEKRNIEGQNHNRIVLSVALMLASIITLTKPPDVIAQWQTCGTGNACLDTGGKAAIGTLSPPDRPLEFVFNGTQEINPIIKVSGLAVAMNTLLQGFMSNGAAGWKLAVAGGSAELFFITDNNNNPKFTVDISNGAVTVTGNIAAKYQDIAEWVPARTPLPAGTVVVLDTDASNQVLPSSRAYDTKVAGVISERPGLLLGETGEGKLKVATTGRVKVKANASRAPIQVGDLLVTSDSEGAAMRSEPLELAGVPIHRPGTVLGKALEPLKEGEGEILVLLTLQ